MAAAAWSLLSPPLSRRLSPVGVRREWVGRKKSVAKIVAKSGGDDDDNTPAFNPFGFVTDNPSSRSAIQLPESPAEDGNVGQMLYVS